MLLFFHTGIHWHRLADYHPLLLDEVACQFPQLRFSMEHVGGYSFFKDAIAVMSNHMRDKDRQLYAGLTSVSDREGNRPFYLSDEQIQDVLWQTGEDSAFFGLDFPYNDASSIKASIERIRNLFSVEVAEKLLCSNLEAALQNDAKR